MDRRHFVGVVATASLAGCAGLFDGADGSRLDLTVRNERADPVDVRVVVVDGKGTTYVDESDRIDGGVVRAFEATVGTEGRHEATVSGDDWTGTVAWHADRCARFEGTVGLTDDAIEVASECVQGR